MLFVTHGDERDEKVDDDHQQQHRREQKIDGREK